MRSAKKAPNKHLETLFVYALCITLFSVIQANIAYSEYIFDELELDEWRTCQNRPVGGLDPLPEACEGVIGYLRGRAEVYLDTEREEYDIPKGSRALSMACKSGDAESCYGALEIYLDDTYGFGIEFARIVLSDGCNMTDSINICYLAGYYYYNGILDGVRSTSKADYYFSRGCTKVSDENHEICLMARAAEIANYLEYLEGKINCIQSATTWLTRQLC